MKKPHHPVLADYVQYVANHSPAMGGYRTKQHIVECENIPLVSIVTVTFNAANTLSRALQSVRNQSYPNIEHIIIDGGSTDKTLEVIRLHEDSIAMWLSEPDRGIYDAFNKGISLAKGQFVGILNADDYYEVDQIEKAVAALLRTRSPFVHGDIVLHGWQGQDVELLGDPHYELRIRERMPSLHQVTTLCRRDIFEKYGLFSLNYRIAGDYDWYLRLAKHGCIGIHDPKIRAHMTAGGISTTQQRRAFWEAFLIVWRHGLALPHAIRSMFPRLMYPNGTPRFILRTQHIIKHPASSVSLLMQRLRGQGNSHVDHVLSGEGGTRSVLAAFIDARHICLTIDPLGLEWVYGVGLRSRTYKILSNDAEAKAVEILLESGGAVFCDKLDRADVLLLDQQHAANLNIANYLEQKKLLITSGGNWSPDKHYTFPGLYFGGVSGYGVHVSPDFTLR